MKIYKYYSNNSQLPGTITKKDGSKYNGPFFATTGGCLGAVGGYNINNYDLLLDITKGKYETHHTCNNTPSTNPNISYKISEGPFYYDSDISTNTLCDDTLENAFDLSYISQFPVDKLTNFDFPYKI